MDEFLEKQRSPHPRPLLLQEKPVHHISNTIPPCDILPTSFSPLRPHQGVAGSCLWEGRQDGQRHLALGSLNLDGPPPSPPSFPPPPPPPPSPPPSSRPLARTALQVRSVNLIEFGGSDEGLANLAAQFQENNYRRRWVSLSRSIDCDCSSSCSSASPLSPSGSVSDHSDCSDLGSEGCWETDSDVG